MRRELYPDFPDTVQDDFTVSMSVIFQGKRLVKAPDVLAFEKVVSERHEELRRKIRIGARAYHTHAFLRPQIKMMSRRDRIKYFSRKILRWFGAVFISFSAIFAVAAMATLSIGAAMFAIAAGALLLALSIRSRSRLLGSGGELVLATFATLLGVTRGMCGQTMATWAPAKSR